MWESRSFSSRAQIGVVDPRVARGSVAVPQREAEGGPKGRWDREVLLENRRGAAVVVRDRLQPASRRGLVGNPQYVPLPLAWEYQPPVAPLEP